MKRPARPVRFTFVVSVVIIVAYLALIRFLAPDDLWPSVSTFVATIISVFAAFFVGLGLYRHQVRTADARRREELSEVLVAELSETVNALEDPKSYEAPAYTSPLVPSHR
jgi:hypothetical protein